MERKKLVTVTNTDIIAELKNNQDVILLYPLDSFCVGYELTFPINKIDDYVLVNRLLTDEDMAALTKILAQGHFKGIVFEDLGLLELLKDFKGEKILMLNHLANSIRSINYYLAYVDSVIISTDLTQEEVINILDHSAKKLVVNVFGLIPLMYSRRLLLTNFQNHYALPLANIKEAQINDKDFKIVENAYGTVFYTGKYFYFPDYQKLNNVLYDYYNPLFLPKETILRVIREDNLQGIATFPFLLNQKTIYKLKEVKPK